MLIRPPGYVNTALGLYEYYYRAILILLPGYDNTAAGLCEYSRRAMVVEPTDQGIFLTTDYTDFLDFSSITGSFNPLSHGTVTSFITIPIHITNNLRLDSTPTNGI